MTDADGPGGPGGGVPGGGGPGGTGGAGEPGDRPEIDIDSAFAAIVAEFSNPTPHGAGPWPASEDLDDEDDVGTGRAAPSAAPGGSAAEDPFRRHIVLPGDDQRLRPDPDDPVAAPAHIGAHRAGPGDGHAMDDSDAVDDSDDVDDRYVPPEPPPLPRGDLVSRVAWGSVLGGPLFLLLAALVWRSLPSALLLVALLAFVGGFVTLVARMPQEHPDDPDDGAVV